MLYTLLLLIASMLLSSGLRQRALDSIKHEKQAVHHEKPWQDLVVEWAPLVWLAKSERFLPLDVREYLENVFILNRTWEGTSSYLVSKKTFQDLMSDGRSWLFGKDPSEGGVPVYADVKPCGPPGHFLVKYWLFFPYNVGKAICTAGSPLGRLPLPLLRSRCLGSYRRYGDHFGDWEHLTLLFTGDSHPSRAYMSVHDTGAYYKWVETKGRFVYEKPDKHLIIIPYEKHFPDTILFHNGSNHMNIYSALGSHGLWAAPGRHKYFKVPRLYDETGEGTAWKTWERVELLGGQDWLEYSGRWGGPRTDCDHPADKLGIFLCSRSEGPPGVRSRDRHQDLACPSK